MKKALNIILIVIVVGVSLIGINTVFKKTNKASDNAVVSRHTVVIDAGHGGKDAGTLGVDNTQEKDINLAIALKLYDYLRVSGINSVLIRNSDIELYPEGSDRNKSDLYNRLDYVNSITDSYLISIHQNHFEDEKEKGTQIWYSDSEEAKALADSILANIKHFIQPDNKRQNKLTDSNYYILYKASVPSIMIECGFMSNHQENESLKKEEYQKDLSFLILTGICEDV
jgi:N-acetylmuramoyl-L-alanine amidase